MRLTADIPILRAQDKSPLFTIADGDFGDIVVLADKLKQGKPNAYIANDEELLVLDSVKNIKRNVFAELPVQAGWCYGTGRKMSGMEWHKSSEVVVACTPCVLILGAFSDIIDDEFDSSKSVALYLDKGEAVELAPLTLHLAPLATDGFFAAAIVLPKGTNAPLAEGIDGCLRAVNKWLVVHPDNEKGIAAGGKIGIIGENIAIED